MTIPDVNQRLHEVAAFGISGHQFSLFLLREWDLVKSVFEDACAVETAAKHCRERCQEMINSTLVHLVQRYHDRDDPFPWEQGLPPGDQLFRLARAACRYLLRKETREGRRWTTDGKGEVADPAARLAEQAADLRMDLSDALTRLPEGERNLVLAFLRQDCENKSKLARAVTNDKGGKERKQVSRQLHRALQRLKKILETHFPGLIEHFRQSADWGAAGMDRGENP
jgi:DNA-directed RNA polymerase specialized sigma24 family protein